MSKYSFIEDAYIDFSNLILTNHYLIDPRDVAAINNFYIKLSNNDVLTEAQSKYIIRLMSKYRSSAEQFGLDYEEILKNPKWKKEFRILDLTKRIFVSESPEKTPLVCLKFPYAFKSIFEKEFLGKFSKKISYNWDHDQKINVINLYEINLVLLQDFCVRHQFEIDDSFLEAVSQVEEIWQHQADIVPCSVIENGKIVLKNVSQDAQDYWTKSTCGDYYQDLFLAKTMGLNLKTSTATEPIEIMASCGLSTFWINDFKKFFDIYKKLNERIAVILDSSDDTIPWLEEFIQSADNAGVSRSEIKICFRENKEDTSGFNNWIRDNNLGGKIDTGKIFIFRTKPAKWLLSEDKNVKIVVTNGLFPSMNLSTQKWILSRPCVIYLGTIKASQTKDVKIVQL